MNSQIDWIPFAMGVVRPTLAVQVPGGTQSINTMRLPDRWMRTITIPNQSRCQGVQGVGAEGRMKPWSYCDRVVNVCGELIKFIWLTTDASSDITDS